MELSPYKTLVRSIVVQQLTQSGWVELIRMPIENPEEATPGQIQSTIEFLHNMIYKSEKVELSIQGNQVCIRGLDKTTATFRVCASAEGVDYPELVA